MIKREIEKFLLEKQGYLKKSPLEVAKKLWKHSSKHNLPKNETELQKELDIIKGVMVTMRVAKTVENDTTEKTLMDIYHKILNEKDRPKRRLFFDIETSFNIVWSWNIGRDISLSIDNIIEERKIICICYKFEDEEETYSLSWDNNNDDKKMLQKFIEVLAKADIVVTHNGDNFDIKHVRARCLYHNIPMPAKLNSTDTLKLARSGFKMNSNKLDYIGRFLGEGKKLDTGGVELWKKIIFNKDKQALVTMIDYCKQDVVLLEKVYHRLKKYTTEKKFK